jgi:hypothetical protein
MLSHLKDSTIVRFIIIAIILCYFQAAFCKPDLNQCEAYSLISEQLGCDDSGYLVSFGERYCRKFVEKNDHFSTYGQAILSDIRTCLISQIEAENHLTCENAHDLAQRHHYNCYLESGYCTLGLFDRMQIGWIVRKELFDVNYLKLIQKISTACALGLD